MIELKKLLKPAHDVADELRRLDLMERDAKQVLKEVGKTGDIESPAIQRKVSDARIRLDLIASRRPILEAQQGETEETMRAASRVESARWNRVVAAARAELAEAQIQAALPFWEGNERACRRYYDSLLPWQPPAFYELDRSLYHAPSAETDPIREAERLVAFINARLRYHGWTEADLARIISAAPAPRSAAKAALPKTIQVRAKETFTSPYFVSQGKNKKRPGLITEGQELEVSLRQFRAMAKWLEPVAPLPESVVNARDWEIPQDTL
jgi:hypothetical protein